MKRTAALVLVCALGYLCWFGAPFGAAARQDDYYNRLAEGMHQGHLWMNLPERVGPDGQLVFANDASIYGGHYYLYFGPTPVVTVLLPFLLVTGRELPLSVPIVLFLGLGILLQAAVFLDAWRRYFPTLSRAGAAVLLFFIAFASAGPCLLATTQVYQAAEAAAYGCLSVAWFGLYRAFHRPTSRLRWLALTGLAAGAGVGARPTLVLLLPLLAAGAIWSARETGRLRALVAVALPAAIIGGLLALYNAARFGRPLEFGTTYQAGVSGGSGGVFFRPIFALRNLHWNLLTPPNLGAYFPYFLPLDRSSAAGEAGPEAVHGQFLLGLAAFAVGLAWCIRRRSLPRMPAALGGFLRILGAAFAVLLLGLACYRYNADRYAVDYAGTLVLLVALTGGWVAAGLSRAARGLVLALLAFATVFNLLFAYDALAVTQRHPAAYPVLSRLGNYPAYWGWKLGLVRYGPRRLTVTFPTPPPASVEPLLSTGSTLGTDRLEVLQDRFGEVTFQFDHQFHGRVASRPQPLGTSPTHVLEIDLGSFYPPRDHPFFDGWTPQAIETVKTTARLAYDGREIIRARMPIYENPSGRILLGTEPGANARHFSGDLPKIQRLPLRQEHDAALVELGIWRVRLEPFLRSPSFSQPVLSAGISGGGDQLLLQTLAGNQVRFGLDCWGAGATYSRPLATDTQLHSVEIFDGYQVLREHPRLAAALTAEQADRIRSSLIVWWDGKRVWTCTPPVFPDCFNTVGLGTNPQGFSSTPELYAGPFEPEPYSESEAAAFIGRNLMSLSVKSPL